MSTFPAGADLVEVPEVGTFGFQSVGNTGYTTGLNIYFQPAGSTDKLPGYGRAVLRLADDGGWFLEAQETRLQDIDITRKGALVAQEWLDKQLHELRFLVKDAVTMELEAIKRDRHQCEWVLSARKKMLQDGRSGGSSEQPAVSQESVDAAQKSLDEYNGMIEGRETMLKDLADQIRDVSRRTVPGRTILDVLADHRAKYGMSPGTEVAPG